MSEFGTEPNNQVNRATGKRVVKLTARNVETLEQQVQMEMIKHVLAEKYFTFHSFWFFVMPQAVLTALASVFAFVAGSQVIEGNPSVWINLVAGVTSACVVLIQTIGGFKIYDKRADRHHNTAVQLRDLRDQLCILKIKFRSEARQMKEEGLRHASSLNFATGAATSIALVDDKEEGLGESFDLIQKRFQQCLTGCSSYVPIEISTCFHGLGTNLELALTEKNRKLMADDYGPDFNEILLLSKSIDILSAEIIQFWLFPLFFPNPKNMVTQTMENLKLRLDETKNQFDSKPKLETLPKLGPETV